MQNYDTVISVGYCDLQDLLRFNEPIAYTSGGYGWNADIYDFGAVAIVTGYQPFGKYVDYDIIRDYNKKAKNIITDYSLKWENQKELLNDLIGEFIGEVE